MRRDAPVSHGALNQAGVATGFELRYPWSGVRAIVRGEKPLTTLEQPEKPSTLFCVVVSVCLVAYMVAVALQMGPAVPLRNHLVVLVAPFLDYTGTWQNFAMFSPEPRRKNLFLSAVVTYSDGATAYYSYPRLERLNFWDRMQKERFRKYGFDSLVHDENRGLWTDFARYVARQSAGSELVPIQVSLQRHESDVPAPKEFKKHPQQPAYNVTTFFVYDVRKEDLK